MDNYQDIDTMKQWMLLSDFYDRENMPYLTYFDSWEDMQDKVNNLCNPVTSSPRPFHISESMREFNEKRKEKVYDKWKSILENIKNA